MYNLLPHSKPSAWFYFDDNCSDTKIKESVACKTKYDAIVYSAAPTAVCSAVQEGTNAVLNIIPGGFQFESLVFFIVN